MSVSNYKIFINNQEVEFKDGFVLKDEYNEKLDSGTIIAISNSELDIQPFDIVRFHNVKTNNDRYFAVDNFIRSTKSFSDPITYEYTINLFSETKLLERITLPNLSITRSLVSEQRTVADYIKHYVEKYVPKIRVSTDGVYWGYRPRYTISYGVLTRFNKIVCPEFSWNEPTLKEVLDDLMKVDDCLCVVNGNVISYFDLNEVGNEIDTSKLSDEEVSMSSADSISDLTITMKNSIGKNLVRNINYSTPRSEGGELTTENAFIMTQHPIYNIKSVKACYIAKYKKEAGTGVTNKYAYIEQDITRFVKEVNEYNILKADIWRVSTPSINEAIQYQQFVLYFTRGSNKIESLGNFEATMSKIEWILRITNNFNIPNYSYENIYTDIRDINFIVEYEALNDRKMKVGKYLPIKHDNNSIFDNQTSSYVNVKQQSLFEYAKANRLGNEIKTIYAVYQDEADVPNLGDHIGSDILFSRELSYYSNYIMFKGNLTKHYVLEHYFTSVASKRRSWQIVKGSEALTRYDIDKLYVEFSRNEKKDILELFGENMPFDLCKKLINPIIYDGTLKPIKHVLVKTYSKHVIIPSTGLYELNFNCEAQGMSLCFNFGFEDNYSVGNYVFDDNGLYVNGIYKYTDENGEFDELQVYFSSYVDPTDGEFAIPKPSTQIAQGEQIALAENLAKIGKRKPLVYRLPDYNDIFIDYRLSNYYKDNREIIKNTLQIEYCSDTETIVATKLMTENNKLVNDVLNECSVFLLTENDYKGRKYKLNDKKPLGYLADESEYTIDYLESPKGNTLGISLKINEGTSPIVAWGLATKDGFELVLGVNTLHTTKSDIIFANLLQNRDDNVYASTLGENVLGKMWEFEHK